MYSISAWIDPEEKGNTLRIVPENMGLWHSMMTFYLDGCLLSGSHSVQRVERTQLWRLAELFEPIKDGRRRERKLREEPKIDDEWKEEKERWNMEEKLRKTNRKEEYRKNEWILRFRYKNYRK